MRHVFAALLLSVAASMAGIEGQYDSPDQSVILDLLPKGKAEYILGTTFSAAGTWKKVTEGKFEGTIAVSLVSKAGSRFTLYFQPSGKKLLGVNTLTVDGKSIKDDTLVALFD